MHLAAGDQAITLDLNLGGRATSWRVGDLELLGARDDQLISYGMYPMAPWAGRLRNNRCEIAGDEHEFPANFGPWAIHGTLYLNPVEVVEQADSEVLLRYLSAPPFHCTIEIRWRLSASSLQTTLQVSTNDESLPAVVGWHPWFNRQLAHGAPAQWDLPDARMAIRGGDYLPNGQLVDLVEQTPAVDDAFFVAGCAATLRWPGALRLDVVNTHPWFVIYDEPESYVLLEPQTGPPNGSNTPIVGERITARVGQPLTMVTDWFVTREQPVDQG